MDASQGLILHAPRAVNAECFTYVAVKHKHTPFGTHRHLDRVLSTCQHGVQRSAAYSGTAAQRSRAGARGCVHNPPVMDSIDTQDTGPAFELKAPGRAFPLGVHTGQNGARMLPFTVACAAGVRSRCCLLHQ